jgi:hypothetical protein
VSRFRNELSNLLDDELHDHYGPSAVSLYSNFRGYEDIALKLSRLASHGLIWTIDGSPLDSTVNPATRLTSADEWFRRHKCGHKIRIVIFRNWGEINRYIRARNGDQRRFRFRRWTVTDPDRSRAFEEACTSGGGLLLFTATFLLDRLTRYDSDVLDIGIIRTKEDDPSAYCFESDFNSSQFSRAREHIGEIKFFRLRDYCRGVPAIAHYKAFVMDLLKESPAEALQSWAFRDPTELRRNVRPIPWLWRRSKRKFAKFLSLLVGSQDASLYDRMVRSMESLAAVIIILGVIYGALKSLWELFRNLGG